MLKQGDEMNKQVEKVLQIIEAFERGDNPSEPSMEMETVVAKDSETVDALLNGLESKEYRAGLSCAEALARSKVDRDRIVEVLAKKLEKKSLNLNVQKAIAETLGEMGEIAKPALPALISYVDKIKKVNVWEHRDFVDALLVLGEMEPSNKDLLQLLKKLIDKTLKIPEKNRSFYGYTDFLENAERILDGPQPSKNVIDCPEHKANVEKIYRLRMQIQRLEACLSKPHPGNPGYDVRAEEVREKDDLIEEKLGEVTEKLLEITDELDELGLEDPPDCTKEESNVFDILKDSGNFPIAAIHELKKWDLDPNIKDSGGFTPLHYGVGRYDEEVIVALLDMGASIDEKDLGGFTPLHLAAFCEYPEIVSLLVGKGASIDIKDAEGKTPMDLAEEIGNSEIPELLKKAKVGSC
jgi:hypothetical protein